MTSTGLLPGTPDDRFCVIHNCWENPIEWAACDDDLYRKGYRNVGGKPVKVLDSQESSDPIASSTSKRTVVFDATKVEQLTVEVQFPIYRKQDIDTDHHSSIVFSRVDINGETFRVHRRDYGRGTSFEIEIMQEMVRGSANGPLMFGRSTRDYALGEGPYKSSAEEFDRQLAEAEKFLARFRSPL